MDLNETQTSILSLVFKYCDDNQMPLLDLADLRTTLQYLSSDAGKPVLAQYGGMSASSVGVLLRSLVTLEQDISKQGNVQSVSPAQTDKGGTAAVFSTTHVPTIHPIVAAKQCTTVDHLSGGRFALNVVCGWYSQELRMFGLPAPEPSGSRLARLIPDPAREAHRRHLDAFPHARVSSRGMAPLMNVMGLRADGSRFPAEFTITRIRLAGHPMFTLYIRDITQRKHAEAELRSLPQRIIKAQEKMKATLEDWIPKILAAQEPDGYLQTAFEERRVHPRGDRTFSGEHRAVKDRVAPGGHGARDIGQH